MKQPTMSDFLRVGLWYLSCLWVAHMNRRSYNEWRAPKFRSTDRGNSSVNMFKTMLRRHPGFVLNISNVKWTFQHNIHWLALFSPLLHHFCLAHFTPACTKRSRDVHVCARVSVKTRQELDYTRALIFLSIIYVVISPSWENVFPELSARTVTNSCL